MAEAAARIAAIDLGASSGRVVVGHGNERGFTLREVHRFANRPRLVDGVLRTRTAGEIPGGSLAELRSFVRRSVHLTRYEPDEQEAAWERADGVVLASPAPVPFSRPCSS
jgi:rhamnulokinase